MGEILVLLRSTSGVERPRPEGSMSQVKLEDERVAAPATIRLPYSPLI